MKKTTMTIEFKESEMVNSENWLLDFINHSTHNKNIKSIIISMDEILTFKQKLIIGLFITIFWVGMMITMMNIFGGNIVIGVVSGLISVSGVTILTYYLNGKEQRRKIEF